MASKTRVKKDIQIFKNSKSSVQYPIFNDCIRYTSDEFWKNLFEDLSIGKCPKCIYISNDTIYSSNKRKGFSYIIPQQGSRSAKEVFTELRELLISNTSICSSIDVSIKNKEIRKQKEDEITNKTTWSEIRKKNMREIFIIKFVVRMKKKYKLDWDQARNLYNIVQLGFLYKTQQSKDVVFKNKQIESINGIEYDSSTSKFVNKFIDNELPREREELEDNDKYLYYYWNKYVVSMSKRH